MDRLGLTVGEYKFLRTHNTPNKIQDFIEQRLVYNFDTRPNGEATCRSPKLVLKAGKAHCFEGALLAGAACIVNGLPAQLMELTAHKDEEHIVALHWREHKGIKYRGCMGMSGYHLILYRDAIFRTPRELALSFASVYHPTRHETRKSLRGYSAIVDLRRFDTAWLTMREPLDHIGDALGAARHYGMFPKEFGKDLRPMNAAVALADARFEGK